MRVHQERSDEEWALDFLKEDGVYVHPGYFFEFSQEGIFVVSLLVEPNAFEEGFEKIVKRIVRMRV